MFKMLESVRNILLSSSLLVFAWIDYKKQKIYLLPLLGVGIAGLLLHLCGQEQTIWTLLAGCAVGLLLLLYGRITGESVGYGDGCLFIMTGIFLGFWKNLELLFTASLLAACYAGWTVLVKKKKNKETFPFVPFVSIAYLLLFICHMWK